MKIIVIVVLLLVPVLSFSQDQTEERPTYCDELPVTYDKVSLKGGSPRASLPRFPTSPTTEYKVQVAILRFTDPNDFPFHSKLVARYRPCEEVWVVESRESFPDKDQAKKLQAELEGYGYRGAYITTLVGYHDLQIAENKEANLETSRN